MKRCVALVKELIHGAIRNNVLPYLDFEFIVAQTISIVNKRPIAFKEALRDKDFEDAPQAITPEMLVHGFDIPVVNVIPEMQSEPVDPEWQGDVVDNVKKKYSQLKKVRENLIRTYNEEFIGQLITQAVNEKDRYKPKKHKEIHVGDIVLLKEKYVKTNNYPMAIVTDVQKNINNEVTGVTVYKGLTKESVNRHINSILPILENETYRDKNTDTQVKVSQGDQSKIKNDTKDENHSNVKEPKKKGRKAAEKFYSLLHDLIDQDLID